VLLRHNRTEQHPNHRTAKNDGKHNEADRKRVDDRLNPS